MDFEGGIRDFHARFAVVHSSSGLNVVVVLARESPSCGVSRRARWKNSTYLYALLARRAFRSKSPSGLLSGNPRVHRVRSHGGYRLYTFDRTYRSQKERMNGKASQGRERERERDPAQSPGCPGLESSLSIDSFGAFLRGSPRSARMEIGPFENRHVGHRPRRNLRLAIHKASPRFSMRIERRPIRFKSVQRESEITRPPLRVETAAERERAGPTFVTVSLQRESDSASNCRR